MTQNLPILEIQEPMRIMEEGRNIIFPIIPDHVLFGIWNDIASSLTPSTSWVINVILPLSRVIFIFLVFEFNDAFLIVVIMFSFDFEGRPKLILKLMNEPCLMLLQVANDLRVFFYQVCLLFAHYILLVVYE